MPRRAKGPRLYLRERAGREPVYVILDRGREVGTGCGLGSEREAEKAFVDYLASKHTPDWGDGHPARILVADVIGAYATEVAPSHAHPELVGFHNAHLLDHFGDMTCADVSGASCRAYVARRVNGEIGSRPVSKATARRELETLSAALRYAHKERRLAYPVPVTYPEKSPPRDRFLTRSEAARLLAGALGWSAVAFDARTRAPCLWRRLGRPSFHVARFILLALYTGTRHEATLALRWGVNSAGGWVDLAANRIYRRGQGEAETNKRRTPIPIPPRLRPHLERWSAITRNGPIEYDLALIKKMRTGFERARDLAHLGRDVTPHVLRHTCATWLLQSGVSTWDVAGYLGTSEAVIRKTYGHHSPEYLSAAAGAFHGRNVGR